MEINSELHQIKMLQVLYIRYLKQLENMVEVVWQ